MRLIQRKAERGTSVLEFAFVAPVLAIILMGVVVIGLNLGRATQVAQIGRDAGSMYVRGVDFAQTGNQQILVRLSQGLGMTTTGGNGVVILSKVTFIAANGCTLPCNAGQYVVTQRVVVGNSTLRTSSFGPAGSVTLDSEGDVANYTTDPNAIATGFGNILVLNVGEFAYVSEAYFPSPDYDLAGFDTGTGVYARTLF
jgi:Flp pilus assembly protein TadG